MGYYAAIEASNWKCRVTDISASTNGCCVEWVLNLGVLVSGRMLNGCYSTFAFLWPLGGEWILNLQFEVFFNFSPEFASKGATGMVVAELMTRAATFWPCYPWVSDPWGSPASCLLLANFGSSIRFYRIHLS